MIMYKFSFKGKQKKEVAVVTNWSKDVSILYKLILFKMHEQKLVISYLLSVK